MNVKIHPSWSELLMPEFKKQYFDKLVDFIKSEYSTKTIYPPGKQIFAAFDHCPFDQVKVVIIGQDPYHGPKQANGLCFSVSDGLALPPSLQNIFKELKNDLGVERKNGDLQDWAKQGVLLLNATLTVQDGAAGSHQNKGWEEFTDAVIKNLAAKKEKLVYILWGSYAQKKAAIVDQSKNLIIKSAHPSPLSAHRGFFGSKPFSQTNEYLVANGIQHVNW